MSAVMENKQLTLPVSVISPIDVARLTREVENLDEFFRQSEIREGGAPQNMPRYSRLLDEVVNANQINLLDKSNRTNLIESFRHLQEIAPVMHISFSADPPGTYIQKIVGWLRQNIHGLVLVRVGLMPNIGAGCVVRTPNKTFDFSLRQYFDSKHDYFMKRLHAVVAPEEVAAETTTETEPSAPETMQENAADEQQTAEPKQNTIPVVDASETEQTEAQA